MLPTALSCRFCEVLAGEVPARVVDADADTLAFLDHRPVFPGHCLVVPRAHHQTLADLPPSLLAPVFGAARRLSRAVEVGLGAEGSFVALNNTVSQSVPHLHVHVVPRRRKDGLRGFFWPRTKYGSEEEADDVADRIRRALGGSGGPAPA